MNPIHSRRRSVRLLGLCLGSAALALIPSIALGADTSSPSTIRAAIGADGSVQSVKQYTATGESSAFSGKLPVTLKISRASSGGTSTYTYHVENVTSQTETVHYTDTAGNERHTSVTLQLPLVAQLGVDVPSSMSNLAATGATVSTTSDGTRHVLWNLVLFAPLGSASQDVTFTAGGSGAPVAELRATTVDPTTTAGLSSSSQDASASFQQDDFWNTYANGGAGGLKQLSTGTGQLVNGLSQLYTGASQLHGGLASGLSGTQQAADGSTQLYDGAKQAYSGSSQLTSGLGKIHTGQQQLTSGLSQIHGGLGQLADKKAGLPAAVSGIGQVLAGIGRQGTEVPPTGAQTIVQGLECVKLTLADISTGTGPAPDGNGTAGEINPCFYDATLNPTAKTPLMGAYDDSAISGAQGFLVLKILATGIPGLFPTPQMQLLINSVDSPDPAVPGVVQGLQQIKDGLNAAVDGVNQLDAGSGQALTGSRKLTAGSGKAHTGSRKLTDGLKKIRDGLQQLSSGLVAGAKSFPQAVDGAGQIADGLKQALDGGVQVHSGIDQVKSQAVDPLNQQLSQASQNEHQKLAVLNAAAGLVASAPGGANATYVLSQNSKDFALAASTSSSHTGRNIGIGLGGLGVLLVGLLGGFALGRQRRVVTHA